MDSSIRLETPPLGTAGRNARLLFEFVLALFFSGWWYLIIGTRYGTRDLERLREAVADRIPGEFVLWLVASIFWVDVGLRMKSRPVLGGTIAIALLMAGGIWRELAFIGHW